MTPFPCTSCGECCRRVGQRLAAIDEAPEDVREHLRAFPYRTDAKGACEQLDEAGRCRVYETRPLICRVDDLAAALGRDRLTTHLASAWACNMMQEEAGLPVTFRVKVTT